MMMALSMYFMWFPGEGEGFGGRPYSHYLTPVPTEDTRPFYKRVLWSTRPWFSVARHTRVSYEWVDEHTFEVEGGFGIGVKAKVDF